MHWRDIPFHPNIRTLRVFALGLTILLGGIAAWRYLVADEPLVALVLAVVGLAIGVVGWLQPAWVRPVFVGWMILVFPLNWVVTHLLLAIIFYGMITPLAFYFRVTGRDLLGRRLRPDQETYWETKEIRDDARSYLRPF